jgi:hypothetical protein
VALEARARTVGHARAPETGLRPAILDAVAERALKLRGFGTAQHL